MKIDVDFKVDSTKIKTKTKLRKIGKNNPLSYDTILDTGCSMTTISNELFLSLGYRLNDPGNIKIIGINGESEGYSTIIDYFEIGGVALGKVRVAIGELSPQFRNSIILGMNILMWYDFALSNCNKKITLVERQFKNININKQDRFTLKNPAAINLSVFIDTVTEE